MLKDREMPELDEFVQAVKDNFPKEAQISSTQIDNLRSIWSKTNRTELIEAYRYAQKYTPLTPLAGIYKHLGGDGIFRPTFNQRFHFDGKKVETGTNWSVIEANIEAQTEKKRQAYDSIHGAGAYDAKELAEMSQIKQKLVDLDAVADRKLAVSQDSKPKQTFTEKDDKWLKELIKEVMKK